MKKSALLGLFATLVFNISAPVRVSSPNSYVLLTNKATYGVDALVHFNGICSMSEITYTGTGKVEWRYYNNTFCSNQNTISPDNATGYIVLIDDIATYHVWAVDYLEYSSTLESLDVQDEGDPCSNVTLSLIGNVPTINLVDATGSQRPFVRDVPTSFLCVTYSI